MNPLSSTSRRSLLAAACVWLVMAVATLHAQSGTPKPDTNEIRIADIQGTLEIIRAGTTVSVLTQTTNQPPLNPGDRLRTRANSRVALRWSDQSVVRFDALTEIEILPPHTTGAQFGLQLFKGIFSFFHRDKPGRIRAMTRGAVAGIEGTEFVLAVDEVSGVERTTLSVIDGKVQFNNEQGALILTNRQQAVAEVGKAPVRTPGFIVNNVLQWCFYYPAVLDLRDLPLTPGEQQALGESLAAYRSGDLLAALDKYPAARQPGSDAEGVYRAALLLSVGQVKQTENALAALPATDPSERLQRLANSLRQLIAAVKRQPNPSTLNPVKGRGPHGALRPQLSTEFLAASYYEQSRAVREDSLKAALHLAWQAATNSPEFGFAWARVAELEFSFGHTDRALDALNKSLALAPRNAQALALKGFLLAAQNKISEAVELFDQAIAVDSALGNAWLGRGLCKIRLSNSAFRIPRSALEDLLVAAALEPQRALLRSYLGKAYGNAGDTQRAGHELDLAKALDPADPTAWLYSALLNEQTYRINEGVRDLEKSQELNDNRRVYRSGLLLDQDRAVRGASLANLYAAAGMREVSVREAARAVNYDYANYSAHLFLAESFNALRDPTRFNLRSETVWFNELLLANLLSPVGGTPLSQNISQQEYSRLFERNRIGLSSSTEYRSDGQVHELASQFGTVGNTGWSLDLDYQHNDGVRPNNELNRIEWYSTIKQQLTPQDSVMLLTKYQDYHSGDNFQYYYPTNARPNFRFDEYQSPIVVAGFHHEWQPGVHTLLLAGRLQNDQRFTDKSALQLSLLTNATSGKVSGVRQQGFDLDYRSEFETYTAELNQILQSEKHTLVLGGRYQHGAFQTSDQMSLGNTNASVLFTNLPDGDAIESRFERISGYGYWTWELFEDFRLTTGLAYDMVTFPTNHRHPPTSAGSTTHDQLNPKASLVWNVREEVTFRGIYSRSLGGVSLDESFRLEPPQLAGFNQSFRTLIPESLVGSVSAPTFETAGAALDLRFKSGTYLGIQAELLNSEVRQQIGVFKGDDSPTLPPPQRGPSSTPERLDYEEQSLAVTLNQLVSDSLSFGAQYKFTRSELHTVRPEIPVSVDPTADRRETANLHQTTLFALFNHSSGFFARAEAQWFHQDNSGYSPTLPPSDFIQGNVFMGYRFRRQRGEFSVGVLNIGGGDYHLNPLNAYSELPRERVFVARLRINL